MSKSAQHAEPVTSAAITQRIVELSSEQSTFAKRAAAAYAARKAGQVPQQVSETERQKLVREGVVALLNGMAPEAMKRAPPADAEQGLLIEIERRDGAIKVLLKELEDIRFAEANQYAEQVKDEWTSICRKWILAANRLQALELRALAIIDRAWGANVRLPLTDYVGCGMQITLLNDNLENATAAAIAAKVISKSDLNEATNVA